MLQKAFGYLPKPVSRHDRSAGVNERCEFEKYFGVQRIDLLAARQKKSGQLIEIVLQAIILS